MDDDYLTPEFYLFFWVVLILVIIVIIAIIIFNYIKQATLFQPTRDEKWYPDIKRCEKFDQFIENYKDVSIAIPDEHLGSIEYCKEYVKGFSDLYLIVGDKNCKGYTRTEINKVKNSKVLNLSELQYINIWKFENFPGNRIVLYFHGNNDNISYRQYVVNICNLLKLNLMLIDYRGYGNSSSQPDNLSLLEDAKTAYKYITQHYDHSQVIIWGESLGGIDAIWTAHKYKANCLVLLSTFADIKTIIDTLEVPNRVKRLIKKFSDSKLMNNGKWIKDVTIPTVIMHSQEDDILPYINAEINIENVSSEKKKLITIQGPHAHPYFTDNQLLELLKFIEIKDREVLSHKNIQKVLDIINNL